MCVRVCIIWQFDPHGPLPAALGAMSLWDKMPKSISRTDDSICFALIPSLLNDLLHHIEGNGRVTRPLLTRCNVNCKVAIPPEHRLNHQVWGGFWRGRLNNSINCACYVPKCNNCLVTRGSLIPISPHFRHGLDSYTPPPIESKPQGGKLHFPFFDSPHLNQRLIFAHN